MPTKITRTQARRINPNSPLLTAYESGRVRALRCMVEPAGASRELRQGYHDAEAEAICFTSARRRRHRR
jgi:hypothetical protein